MEKIEEVMAIASKYYQEWEQNPTRLENGYNYEATFVEMTQKMCKEILEASLGELPKNKNAKKKQLPGLEK